MFISKFEFEIIRERVFGVVFLFNEKASIRELSPQLY
jgi:hypothetical protein